MERKRRAAAAADMKTVSPARTPRTRDLSSRQDKEKGVNVQVIVRCRPPNEEEKRLQTPVIISCNEIRREVSAAQFIANKQIDRTFTFDKVFGPTSKQKDLFDHAVSPIVNEMLEGYNCTIFAYGQTGTGKTYTMEGGARKKNGDIPSDAGVIPRSVRRIFDILEDQQAEYSMKVSHLELYNEELTDLLAPEETSKFVDDKSKKPLALMEDGKGVFVRGLEEEMVTTADEIYKILEKGSAKRRTAETLLNKQSSRSHSIFTITIHIKEYTPEGEEVIKCGKLKLVDLAGSENLSRSGAREGRAREAGEFNKSLLTLGRCINALVEHSGHVPFRDSKLARILRDSLGGKTKTCIIATIAPSATCLEETLSTLDYAHRAKNIRNKPEINQKMMKSALMKDLYFEIERLKQEVYATREKNGIYIPRDRYLQEEAEKKALTEKVDKFEQDMDTKDKHLLELQGLHESQQQLAAELSNKLEMTELAETDLSSSDPEEKHRQANATIEEKEYIITNLLRSEKALVDLAIEVRTELESAASDISSLFTKIERKDKIEDGNRTLVQKFQSQFTQQLQTLHKTVAASLTQQEQQLKDMEDAMQSFVSTKAEAAEEIRQRLEKLKAMYGSGVKALDELAGEIEGNTEVTFKDVNLEVSKRSLDVEEHFNQFAAEANALLNELQSGLCDQEEKIVVYAQKQREAHARTVETTRSISKVTVNFFTTLDIHASKLTHIVEEAQSVSEQKLSDLERKFEECAAKKERQLLEKVAELLASSNAQKKELVQTAVHGLRETATSRTSQLQQETSTMHQDISDVKSDWTGYVERTESQYIEDTSAVENGKNGLEEVLHSCLNKAKMGAQQWKDAQESLLSLQRGNVSSIESIIKGGMEANLTLWSNVSSSASSTLQDADVANKDLLVSVDHSLQLDHDARNNIDSTIAPCCKDVRKLKSGHYHKVAEITDNAGKCLLTEYRAGFKPRISDLYSNFEGYLVQAQNPEWDGIGGIAQVASGSASGSGSRNSNHNHPQKAQRTTNETTNTLLCVPGHQVQESSPQGPQSVPRQLSVATAAVRRLTSSASFARAKAEWALCGKDLVAWRKAGKSSSMMVFHNHIDHRDVGKRPEWDQAAVDGLSYAMKGTLFAHLDNINQPNLNGAIKQRQIQHEKHCPSYFDTMKYIKHCSDISSTKGPILSVAASRIDAKANEVKIVKGEEFAVVTIRDVITELARELGKTPKLTFKPVRVQTPTGYKTMDMVHETQLQYDQDGLLVDAPIYKPERLKDTTEVLF